MKKINYLIFGLLVLATAICCFVFFSKSESPLENLPSDPKIDGYVPNEVTAVKIAEAVWLPLYGDYIYLSKPFKAELKGDVWIVTGTLRSGARGGVPYAAIKKSDGKIIEVYHGK